ncbi:MAG: tRNA (adenosine(37)-N6)-threonylcarbamoyltransferase complex dimerization subunit type 1 TsaB [Bacilli bacterium]|nr:tRNA (adenosine(37)-N6)-threonylcarbamoyltransferase complex dimerization subunit type 1 TsaB [Bacilli bacterium]
MSKILIVDTATKYIYLSLVIDNHEVQSIYQEGINNHSVTIIPFLDELLEQEHIGLQDLDEVIVGVGPGSYTGVRIGVTVAKMIGYLNNIPVKTISSLALIASSSDAEYVIPYVDARRGNAFITCFKQVNGKLDFVTEESLEQIETYLEQFDFTYDFIAEGKPNANKIIQSNLLQDIDEIHELKPNYLRITEAERNKHGNHD